MRISMAFLLSLLGTTWCLGAGVYPNKPVRVIISYGAGSGTDTVGRMVMQRLSEQLGRQFVVENRTGAGGIVGNGILAKSTPDGYTLIVPDTGTTITASLYKSLPYDVAKDFAPISQFARTPAVLVVNPSLNVSTLKELIALAQANPGKYNYGSSGVGGSLHLFVELFKIAAKINIKHIPYDGGGTMLAAAVSGTDVQVLMTAIATTKQLVTSGRLRPLAVTTDGKRVPSMPEVPSMSEAGIAGMTIYLWQGLAGPAGIPREVANKLHTEVARALAVPAVQQWFVAQDAETVGSSPEQFSLHVRNELRRWSTVIKEAGITID